MIRAKEHLGKCEDKDCKFNPSGTLCCFGMRNRYGCANSENSELIDKRMNTDMMLRQNALRSGGSHALEIVDDITINKVFEFVFKGHHYTMKDSARNQMECPHCSNQSKGSVWNEEDDKESFIGIKKVSDKQYLWCFECPKCFEKFFYHNSFGDRK